MKAIFLKGIFALLTIFLICNTVSYAQTHVLYMEEVYGTTQNLCVSVPMPQDTIIIHTTNAFAGAGANTTDWRLNGTMHTPTCDSMIFIATAPGSYAISAYSLVLGYQRTFGLTLFAGAPSHSNFTVSGNGYINATNDTISVCDGTIEVSSDFNFNEATSIHWGSTTGFYSADDPVTITTPGTYFHYKINPCDTTIDTFVVKMLPNTLPSLSNAAFCNTPINTIFDVGAGWTSILWNTGNTTQTLVVDTAGYYTVNVSNVCISGSAGAIISHETYELPSLLSYEGTVECYNSVIVLDPNPSYPYQMYNWSTGANTPTISISGVNGSGLYQVTVTQGACTEVTGAMIGFYDPPRQTRVCIVTVDHPTNKNMIVGTNEDEVGSMMESPIASYNVYKWTTGTIYNLIGSFPVNQEHTYIDMLSSPPSISARYKIAMVDECGAEGPKSFYHQTIHLSATLGSTPGEIPLMWTPYEDEENSFTPDYEVWRGNHPDSLEFYKSVGGVIAFTDTGVYSQKYYQIVAMKPGGCDPSPAGSKSIVNGTYSNVQNGLITNVPENTNSIPDIVLYPNPSDGIFSVRGKDITKVEVFDLTGRTIVETTSTHIDLSAYGAGYYKVRITTKYGPSNQQIIICK